MTDRRVVVKLITTSLFDLDVALSLYDRLNEHPASWFAASQMKLPCIAFQLPPLSSYRTRSGRVYRAQTLASGMVKIKIRCDLSRMHPLYVVHPWVDTLLEHEGKSGMQEDIVSLSSPNMDDDEFELFNGKVDDDEEILDEDADDSSSVLGLEPHRGHVTAHMEREARARRLVARLGQPFGALLLTLSSSGGRTVDYRRVATDSMIKVQSREDLSLTDILDNVCTLDIL